MAKAKKKTRRIVKAMIDYISLCPKGANCISTIYKSDEGSQNVDLQTICKDMNELGEIIAVVYAPEMEDSQGDIASAAVIKDFAYDFQKNGAGIDIQHNGEVLSKDAVFVAESFIVQKGDGRFVDITDYDNNIVDVTDGWGVVIKVDDEDLRKLYRSGEWSGVSMGGTAFKKTDDKDSILSVLKELIRFKDKSNKTKKNAENNMDFTKENKTELAEMIAKGISDADKIKADAAAELLKKEESENSKLGLKFSEPVLKANPSMEDLESHRRRLKIFELSKTVDSSNAEAVFEFKQKAAEIAKCEKLEDVIEKQAGSCYDTFFASNQAVSNVEKASNNSDTDDTADIIFENMKKEEEAKK